MLSGYQIRSSEFQEIKQEYKTEQGLPQHMLIWMIKIKKIKGNKIRQENSKLKWDCGQTKYLLTENISLNSNPSS